MNAEEKATLTEQELAREDFLLTVVDGLEGWLDRFAAKRTYDLLLAQERFNVTGGLYEIGLFRGKYFSILVDAGFRSSSPVLGVDTFDYVAKSDFLRDFMGKMGPRLLQRAGQLSELDTTVIQTPSTALGAAEMLDELRGANPRFISIDGSHEYSDVLWDLGVATKLLAHGGIIALDDYLHPICLGVTAAVDRFLATTEEVVPFAYVCNKLFLSRPAWASRYRRELVSAILQDQGDPKARAFNAHADSGPAGQRNIEVRYLNYHIVTVPL